MYLNKQLKQKLALLADDMQVPVKVVQRKEYPTLLIDGREITQGEFEVKQRIDVLIRERGLQYSLED